MYYPLKGQTKKGQKKILSVFTSMNWKLRQTDVISSDDVLTSF